jgi:N-acetylglucosamine-6-phosphate deacetylase
MLSDGQATSEVLIAAPRLIPATGPEIFEPGYVAVRAGVVTAVAPGPPPRQPDVALQAGLLLPGLVDLQVNGYFGVELMTASSGGWARVATRLPETGTTAFLPTFITGPPGDLSAALRAAAALIPDLPARAARVLGVHAEGPFISPARKGAHNEAWIQDPDPAAVDRLLESGGGVLRLVTLAPERDGALAAITRLAGAGILVSVGHSDATARQVAQAAGHGARMVTHLFNAQRPLHHREPGVVGQALTDLRITSGLIADMHHVAAQACVLAFAAAPGRICVVTDAAACAGMPPGRYLLGGEPIELPPGDGEPPVRADGTLAGSALRMDAAVANLVAAGVGLAEAITAASRVPADLIGRPDLGRIAPGATADLAWLDDDMRTRATWIGGELVYSRAGDGLAEPASVSGGRPPGGRAG